MAHAVGDSAERRCGELLGEMESNKGTRGQLRGEGAGGRIVIPPGDPAPKLSDLGISKTGAAASAYARLVALYPTRGRTRHAW